MELPGSGWRHRSIPTDRSRDREELIHPKTLCVCSPNLLAPLTFAGACKCSGLGKIRRLAWVEGSFEALMRNNIFGG